eukprot:5177525-Amphidinium_carterae.2
MVKSSQITTKMLKRPTSVAKKILKRPTSVAKKPAAAAIIKRPSVFFMPVRPKKGAALRAMRRPTCRDNGMYTRHRTVSRHRRERAPVDQHDMAHRMKSDRECSSRLVRIGLLKAPKFCCKCGSRMAPQLATTAGRPSQGDDAHVRRNQAGAAPKRLNELHQRMLRCSNTKCRYRLNNLLIGHPFFTSAGRRHPMTLAKQMTIVRGLMQRESQVTLRLNTALGHATIERLASRVRAHVRQYVHITQRDIVYGGNGSSKKSKRTR